MKYGTPDNEVHVANVGPTWILSAPDVPHIGPMNLAIRDMFVVVRAPRTCVWSNILMDTRGDKHFLPCTSVAIDIVLPYCGSTINSPWAKIFKRKLDWDLHLMAVFDIEVFVWSLKCVRCILGAARNGLTTYVNVELYGKVFTINFQFYFHHLISVIFCTYRYRPATVHFHNS